MKLDMVKEKKKKVMDSLLLMKREWRKLACICHSPRTYRASGWLLEEGGVVGNFQEIGKRRRGCLCSGSKKQELMVVQGPGSLPPCYSSLARSSGRFVHRGTLSKMSTEFAGHGASVDAVLHEIYSCV